MEYSNGEIKIAPKVIYWVAPPSIIGEGERIELLKRDVMLIDFPGSFNSFGKLHITLDKFTAYFFNLDEILIYNKVKPSEYLAFAINLLQFIKGFAPEKSLVHSSIINKDLAKIFLSQGISYIEKNLSDRKAIFSTLLNMIKPFFTEKQQLQRSMVRLNLLPLKFKAELTNLDNPLAPTVQGVIKDLSLNGMGLVLFDKNNGEFFKLKDKIQVRLHLQKSIIKINKSLLIRVIFDTGELGIMYNINDSHMIRDDYASRLTSMIYNWLKSIMKKEGRLSPSGV